MIVPTTFILALIFAPIAWAVPQPCRDSIFPGSSTSVGQYDLGGPQPLVATFKAVFNSFYDNPNGSLNGVACSNIEPKYKQFHNIPLFPFVGGGINTTFKSQHCGAIWRIRNLVTGRFIDFVSIDSSSSFDLSKRAFVALGGQISVGFVIVDATLIGHIPGTPWADNAFSYKDIRIFLLPSRAYGFGSLHFSGLCNILLSQGLSLSSLIHSCDYWIHSLSCFVCFSHHDILVPRYWYEIVRRTICCQNYGQSWYNIVWCEELHNWECFIILRWLQREWRTILGRSQYP